MTEPKPEPQIVKVPLIADHVQRAREWRVKGGKSHSKAHMSEMGKKGWEARKKKMHRGVPFNQIWRYRKCFQGTPKGLDKGTLPVVPPSPTNPEIKCPTERCNYSMIASDRVARIMHEYRAFRFECPRCGKKAIVRRGEKSTIGAFFACRVEAVKE